MSERRPAKQSTKYFDDQANNLSLGKCVAYRMSKLGGGALLVVQTKFCRLNGFISKSDFLNLEPQTPMPRWNPPKPHIIAKARGPLDRSEDRKLWPQGNRHGMSVNEHIESLAAMPARSVNNHRLLLDLQLRSAWRLDDLSVLSSISRRSESRI